MFFEVFERLEEAAFFYCKNEKSESVYGDDDFLEICWVGAELKP